MHNTYCIFTALYLPHVGGVENYTYNLARELTDLGNKVIIVCCNTEDAAAFQDSYEGIIYRLPCSTIMNGRFPIIKNDAIYKTMMEEIREHHIDRVIVNTRFYPLSIAGVEFAESIGVTPIVIEHGSAHLTVGNAIADKGIRFVEHSFTSQMKKHPARFFGVSKKAVMWLEHFGIKGEGVLSNSIDANQFRSISSGRDFRTELGIGQNAPVVGFTGRLVPEKGIVQLVDAASTSLCKNAHFVIAGNGPLYEGLSAKAGNNVHLVGSLSREDVSAMLSQCDIFCMPTRSEGFSTSLLEAAAHGLALISTDVGGVDELIPDEDHGIVLEDAKLDAVALTIGSLSNDIQRAHELGSNARQRVEQNFNWKAIAQKVEGLFTT